MSEHAPSASAKGSLNPAALPIEDAARVLSHVGGSRVTVAELSTDFSSGAPVNADGTINLVHYAAWLVKEVSDHGD